MAVGTTTALLIGAGVAGAGASKLMAPKSQKSDASPIPLPTPPSIDASIGKADEVIRKKKAAMSQSIYTSPLGVSGEAQVARKTLLGQ